MNFKPCLIRLVPAKEDQWKTESSSTEQITWRQMRQQRLLLWDDQWKLKALLQSNLSDVRYVRKDYQYERTNEKLKALEKINWRQMRQKRLPVWEDQKNWKLYYIANYLTSDASEKAACPSPGFLSDLGKNKLEIGKQN
jgi:hypothetical protein